MKHVKIRSAMKIKYLFHFILLLRDSNHHAGFRNLKSCITRLTAYLTAVARTLHCLAKKPYHVTRDSAKYLMLKRNILLFFILFKLTIYFQYLRYIDFTP